MAAGAPPPPPAECQLPAEVIAHIATFADIRTRAAMRAISKGVCAALGDYGVLVGDAVVDDRAALNNALAALNDALAVVLDVGAFAPRD